MCVCGRTIKAPCVVKMVGESLSSGGSFYTRSLARVCACELIALECFCCYYIWVSVFAFGLRVFDIDCICNLYHWGSLNYLTSEV